ncbi:MAG: hypothetical protein ACRC4M_04450 [Mycoplasma sp.]
MDKNIDQNTSLEQIQEVKILKFEEMGTDELQEIKVTTQNHLNSLKEKLNALRAVNSEETAN